MAAPCCPPGSHGPLPPDDVELKGWWERKADLDCYFTGEKGKLSMIILAFSDVFGPMSGKHRRVCDQMASAIHGSLICLPDLFEGEPLCPDFCDSSLPKLRLFLYVPLLLYRIRYRHGWEQMLPKIQGLLNSFQSADSDDSAVPISCFGFCFGAYLAVKGSALGAFRASVGFHPSLVVGRLQCSPHGQGHADLAREVKCPQMMLPAGNDDAAVKPNGEFMTLVTAAFPSSRSVCFDQMLHGWVNRGAEDPMVPQAAGGESVSEAQASALKLAAEFLQAHGAS